MLDLSSFGLGSGFAIGSDYAFVGDAADANKLQAVQPGAAGTPWWESLLQVGVTRAIDSHFQSEELDRILQVKQVGIQGANGYTYAPGVNPYMQQGAVGGINLPMLLLLGLGAVIVMKVID